MPTAIFTKRTINQMCETNVVCIVVTFNGDQWIEKCLSSICSSSVTMNVICIDNGSTDNTINIIQNKFPAVQLIKTARNLGFGQANNMGFSLALAKSAKYIFLLNQDAFIFNDTVSNLIEAAESRQQFGILSPLHLNGDGSKFDSYFFRYLTESDIAPYLYSQLLHAHVVNPIIETSFVNAAAWLLSADCVKKVGGFDRIFFHYGEDKNYCQRVLSKGFSIGICTNSKVMHDREERTAQQTLSVEGKIKREWTHFLTIACDVSNKKYKIFMLKEFINHLSKTLACILLLDLNNLKYHFLMSSKIPVAAGKIIKSRIESSGNSNLPHL